MKGTPSEKGCPSSDQNRTLSVVKREIAVVFTTAISILVDPIGIEPTTLRMRTVRSPERDTARAPLFWPSKAFCQLYLGPCIARDS